MRGWLPRMNRDVLRLTRGPAPATALPPCGSSWPVICGTPRLGGPCSRRPSLLCWRSRSADPARRRGTRRRVRSTSCSQPVCLRRISRGCRARRRTRASRRLLVIQLRSPSPSGWWSIRGHRRSCIPGPGSRRSRCCHRPSLAPRPGFRSCRAAQVGSACCSRAGPTAPPGGSTRPRPVARSSTPGAAHTWSRSTSAPASSASSTAAGCWEPGRRRSARRPRRRRRDGPSCLAGPAPPHLQPAYPAAGIPLRHAGHLWARPRHGGRARLAQPVRVRPRGQPRLCAGPRGGAARPFPGPARQPRPDHLLAGRHSVSANAAGQAS